MAAVFWWDEEGDPNGAAGIPGKVIRGLAGELDDVPRHKPNIRSFWDEELDDLTYIKFKKNFCLYMSGTTDELQRALDDDLKKGTIGILTVGDKMDIRFFRKRAGPAKTKSVVGLGAHTGYWDKREDYTIKEAAQHKDWALMLAVPYTGKLPIPQRTFIGDKKPVPYTQCSGVGLKYLQEILERGKGIDWWID